MELGEKIHNELKDFIVSVGWTHKIHAVKADGLSRISTILKTTQVVSAALTSSGIISTLVTKGSLGYNYFIAILSFITVLASALEKSWNIEEQIRKERSDVDEFYRMKEKAIQLLRTVQYDRNCNILEIEIEYKKLFNRKLDLGAKLSNTTRRTINQARVFLKEKRDNDYSEDYKYLIPNDLLNYRGKDD